MLVGTESFCVTTCLVSYSGFGPCRRYACTRTAVQIETRWMFDGIRIESKYYMGSIFILLRFEGGAESRSA